jgi:glycogen(starch) synthase
MSTHRLFEVSWEVCNKVGGIHTVITSKLGECLAEFGDRYLAIGPYIRGNTPQNFGEEPLPAMLQPLEEDLNKQGIGLHYGHWLVYGEPAALLIDWKDFTLRTNEIKQRFWDQYQLDSMGTVYYDFDEPILWSSAVGFFVKAFAEYYPEEKITAHVHEWMSGGVVLVNPKGSLSNLRTVFTTHATVLGRALTSRGVLSSEHLNINDPDQEARNSNVLPKHQAERLSAAYADVFTAVSDLTAKEAEMLIGVPTTAIVENGLNLDDFPDFAELSQQHETARERLHRFVMAFFFPSYQFNLDKTVYQFTMGRYEYHNKGYDLYLQALGELNTRLQKEGTDKTVVALIMVPGDVASIKEDFLTQLNVAKQLNAILNEEVMRQRHAIIRSLWDDEVSQKGTLGMVLPPPLRAEVDALMSHLPQATQPSLSPFEVRSGDNDAILQGARQYGLLNREEDRVKVVFLPKYFDGFDGIFNVPLYDLVVGCDLGVFPSAYEPWGYTPMEGLILGVPVITSTLSGFGHSMESKTQANPEGVLLLKRKPENSPEALADLVAQLHLSVEESNRQWVLRRVHAYTAIQDYSWKILYPKYSKLYQHPTATKS